MLSPPGVARKALGAPKRDQHICEEIQAVAFSNSLKESMLLDGLGNALDRVDRGIQDEMQFARAWEVMLTAPRGDALSMLVEPARRLE